MAMRKLTARPRQEGENMLDPEKSLYHRLGGYDAIAAAVDDLMPRLTSDPQIGVYWKGKCIDSMKRDRQLLIDFACASSGGPSLYLGRDMKTSHAGLGISESDWNVLMRHIAATLTDLGVADREKAEFLALVETLNGEIVETRHATGTEA
jgi:hemoglobin